MNSDRGSPHRVHVVRKEVNGEHAADGAGYADGPSQDVDHQLVQLLAPSLLHVLMTDLRQELLDKDIGREGV